MSRAPIRTLTTLCAATALLTLSGAGVAAQSLFAAPAGSYSALPPLLVAAQGDLPETPGVEAGPDDPCAIDPTVEAPAEPVPDGAVAALSDPLPDAETVLPLPGEPEVEGQPPAPLNPEAVDPDTSIDTKELVSKLTECDGVLKPVPQGDAEMVEPAPDAGRMPIIDPDQLPGNPQ